MLILSHVEVFSNSYNKLLERASRISLLISTGHHETKTNKG